MGLKVDINDQSGGETTKIPFDRRFDITKMQKITINIAFFCIVEYTKCNRVARSLLDIGDQAESCAQLFYFKGEILWI